MICDENNLIWLDMEMSGLDPNNDRILQIATVVTDTELNILAEGPEIEIHQPNSVLDGMDHWNTEHHTASGLVKQVRNSTTDEAKAESMTLQFISQYVPEGKSPICGNSIHQDRRFLYNYMPTLEQYFHYRNLDVSTLKILAQRWALDIARGFNKDTAHTALKDVYESIEELRYYRKHFLRY